MYIQRFHTKHIHHYLVDADTGEAVCLCGKVRGQRTEGTRKNKYNAQSCYYEGYYYDSIAEAQHAQNLDLLKKGKVITDWERQYKIEIMSPLTKEKICGMRIDFRVRLPDNSYRLEEVKGYPTPEYLLKRKLLEHLWLPQHLDHTYEEIKATKHK